MVKTNQSDVSLSSPQFKFTSDGLREALRQALDQLGAPFFLRGGNGILIYPLINIQTMENLHF